ncbi:short-chain dehydrogenase/reductase SDR [Segniliparus rotundus DSM 44985]|uniref:Short-chain dehydrogenase/reductase SDR n=1 Tax=Segniliparus rotundus (strain ATCC BAA-972 / CDC 1076 / CIP 108378 / DSM 44985 / JCM 13578) TaxID=640132 RepID=D6ZAL7_SEGRD|nr:SDR family NAD(P)-dependent oxidoreductase [Segniliparus rotundus]ADG98753.1 short-chain dehydrogenase/reductase SDR [Segniliparus rotundus DSM 44985]
MSFRPSRSLVTGASSGIGMAFAWELAARGSDLVLVARREERLERVARELRTAHGITCETVAFDLSVDRAGAALRQRLVGDFDLVVNNAGFATQGPFVSGSGEEFARVIAVDVRAVVDMCNAFLPAMVERGQGAIVNVSSTTAFQPVPSLAVYSAAKAFVQSFSQSLWYEAKQHDVKVFALAPGPTQTEFFEVIGEGAAVAGRMQTAKQVAATGMRALDRRSTPPYVVSGIANSWAARLAALAPRRLLIPFVARILHPMRPAPPS